MKSIRRQCACFCAAWLSSMGAVYAQGAAAAIPAAEPPRATLALSPAVVMLRGKPGQSATQRLTISNGLPAEQRFNIEVEDVVVRNGNREYLPAGQIPFSIAASAVASPASIVAPPGQSVTVNVTFTAPADSTQRAVVVFFKLRIDPKKESIGFGASLGALITFNLSDNARVVAGPLAVTPQTATANLNFSQELENTGAEPATPQGVLAILDARGKRVAKAVLEPRRLLPGERVKFAVASPAFLSPGHYRALASFEYEGKVLTNAGEFTVSE